MLCEQGFICFNRLSKTKKQRIIGERNKKINNFKFFYLTALLSIAEREGERFTHIRYFKDEYLRENLIC